MEAQIRHNIFALHSDVVWLIITTIDCCLINEVSCFDQNRHERAGVTTKSHVPISGFFDLDVRSSILDGSSI